MVGTPFSDHSKRMNESLKINNLRKRNISDGRSPQLLTFLKNKRDRNKKWGMRLNSEIEIVVVVVAAGPPSIFRETTDEFVSLSLSLSLLWLLGLRQRKVKLFYS